MLLFFRRSVISISQLIMFVSISVSFAVQDSSTVSKISEQMHPDSLTLPISNISEKADTDEINLSQNIDTVKSADSVTTSKNNVQPRNAKRVINKPHVTSPPPSLITNERVPKKGQIITGSALFGVSYGLALYVAVASSNSSGGSTGSYFAIPVIGPIVAEIVDPPSSEISGPINLLCIGWTAAQSIGIFLLIKGIVGERSKIASSNSTVMIAPYAMNDKVGINLSFLFDSNK